MGTRGTREPTGDRTARAGQGPGDEPARPPRSDDARALESILADYDFSLPEAQIAIAVTQLWLSADESLSKRIAEIDRLLAHSIASAGKDALAAHARACNGRPLA